MKKSPLYFLLCIVFTITLYTTVIAYSKPAQPVSSFNIVRRIVEKYKLYRRYKSYRCTRLERKIIKQDLLLLRTIATFTGTGILTLISGHAFLSKYWYSTSPQPIAPIVPSVQESPLPESPLKSSQEVFTEIDPTRCETNNTPTDIPEETVIQKVMTPDSSPLATISHNPEPLPTPPIILSPAPISNDSPEPDFIDKAKKEITEFKQKVDQRIDDFWASNPKARNTFLKFKNAFSSNS